MTILNGVKRRVVLVEDDDGLRNELIITLGKAPDIDCLYSLSSAEEALALIPKNPPDVILMDVKLPGLSGIDCLPALKEKVPSAEVLMLTVYDDSEIIFRALKAGASGYLLKSSPAEALYNAIRDVASGGSAFSADIARKVVYFFQASEKPANDCKNLSPKEVIVLEFIASGYIDKEIADKMGISPTTVKTHIKRIYKKMHVHSRAEATNKRRS